MGGRAFFDNLVAAGRGESDGASISKEVTFVTPAFNVPIISYI